MTKMMSSTCSIIGTCTSQSVQWWWSINLEIGKQVEEPWIAILQIANCNLATCNLAIPSCSAFWSNDGSIDIDRTIPNDQCRFLVFCFCFCLRMDRPIG